MNVKRGGTYNNHLALSVRRGSFTVQGWSTNSTLDLLSRKCGVRGHLPSVCPVEPLLVPYKPNWPILFTQVRHTSTSTATDRLTVFLSLFRNYSINYENYVDKKNQLGVTFCILCFSSNSCSTCFGQPCAHHQELTTAWCYRLVLVCAVAAGRWSSPVGR